MKKCKWLIVIFTELTEKSRDLGVEKLICRSIAFEIALSNAACTFSEPTQLRFSHPQRGCNLRYVTGADGLLDIIQVRLRQMDEEIADGTLVSTSTLRILNSPILRLLANTKRPHQRSQLAHLREE